jgi:hypothetical protein
VGVAISVPLQFNEMVKWGLSNCASEFISCIKKEAPVFAEASN